MLGLGLIVNGLLILNGQDVILTVGFTPITVKTLILFKLIIDWKNPSDTAYMATLTRRRMWRRNMVLSSKDKLA